MARLSLLAALLLAIGTLPARAQAPYSEPPLPGDDVEDWQDASDMDDDDDAPEAGDVEDIPGAAAGPADAEEARAFEAYLQELEAEQEASGEPAQAPLTEIPEEDAAPAQVAAPQAVPAQAEPAHRDVPPGFYLAQNPYFSLTVEAGTTGNQTRDYSTVVDAALRFEGDRGGLLISFGGRTQGYGNTTDIRQTVFALEPTFAIIANEGLRWRVRGGWSVAANDLVSMSGISVGTSAVMHIAGPLDLEFDVHFTPFPFTRLEGKAAAALHFAFVSVRLGWMGSVITDHGLGRPGAAITSTYNGLFLGFGLHI